MAGMDDNMDTDSSDVSEIDDAHARSLDPNAPADSSSATGEPETPDLLSVVRDVVDARKPEEQAASPAEGEEGKDPEAGAAANGETEDDFSDVPFNKHPRWKQLLTQRNTARTERDSLKTDAERYQNVQGFIDSQGLDPDEAADMLVLAGLLKTNPIEAWKRAKPTIEKLLIAAGEILPDDLKQMVEAGRMDRGAAMEVSRSRAALASSQALSTFQQQRQEKQRTTEAVSAISGAATTWESDRRQKDPNFEAKLVPIQKEVLFLQRSEGIPKTPEGVKVQLDKAYAAVNRALPPKAPVAAPAAAKPAVRPVTGGTVAGDPQPRARGTADVMKDVLARRRA